MPSWNAFSPTTAPGKVTKKVGATSGPPIWVQLAVPQGRGSLNPWVWGGRALMIRTWLPPPSGQSPLLRSSKPHHFLLGHSHGTNWVEYNAAGWLSYTKQNPATQNAPRLLQDSQK